MKTDQQIKQLNNFYKLWKETRNRLDDKSSKQFIKKVHLCRKTVYKYLWDRHKIEQTKTVKQCVDEFGHLDRKIDWKTSLLAKMILQRPDPKRQVIETEEKSGKEKIGLMLPEKQSFTQVNVYDDENFLQFDLGIR